LGLNLANLNSSNFLRLNWEVPKLGGLGFPSKQTKNLVPFTLLRGRELEGGGKEFGLKGIGYFFHKGTQRFLLKTLGNCVFHHFFLIFPTSLQFIDQL